MFLVGNHFLWCRKHFYATFEGSNSYEFYYSKEGIILKILQYFSTICTQDNTFLELAQRGGGTSNIKEPPEHTIKIAFAIAACVLQKNLI